MPVQKILHIAHGITSYHNSLTALARLCGARSIEFHVACHVDLSEVLRGTRAEFRLLRADQEIAERYHAAMPEVEAASPVKRLLEKRFRNRTFRAESLRTREIQALVDELRPDLLLIDMECHVAIVQALCTDVKIVLCSRWFTVFREPGIPPMHTRLHPDSRVMNELAWVKLWLSKRASDVRFRLSRKRFRPITYHSASRYDLSCLARSCGVALANLTDQNHWLIPHVYTDLPVMSLTMRELEFGDAVDGRMNYVGPLVGEANIKDSRYRESLQALHGYLDERGNARRKPLIYCSLSTFWQSGNSNLQILLALFSRRTDLDLIIGLGGNTIPDFLNSVPENIHVLEFAPQIDILKHASIVITHGGISTINESLFYGVPLIVCSSGHVDQDGCMARVDYHGVGLSTTSKHLDEGEVERLVDTLLDDAGQGATVKHNVLKLQQAMQKHRSEDTVIQYLERTMKA